MPPDPYFPDPYASMTDDDDLHARMEHAAQMQLQEESRRRAAEWAASEELGDVRPIEDRTPKESRFVAE